MTNPSTDLTPTGAAAARDRTIPVAAVQPTAYAVPAQFLEPIQIDDLATLAQVSAQLLEDPIAVYQLSDRVFELLQQDLFLQRERGYGYGRRS
jgi:hypothetical protein